MQQERWSAASGFRVILRLDTDRQRRADGLSLVAAAAALHNGASPGTVTYAPGSLRIAGAPLQFPAQADEKTPQRQSELEKDPVLGARKPFRPELKARRLPLAGEAVGGWWLRDLLPDLAHTYNVPIVADAYSISSREFEAFDPLPREPTALFELLDRLSGTRYRWEQRGKLITLRSRTWFLDRPREIPLRLVRPWKVLLDRYGALPLDDCVRMATDLTDAQIENLPVLDQQRELPMGELDLTAMQRGCPALRLYGSLSAAQQQALWRGETIAVPRMTPAQQALFLANARERGRDRTPPPDLTQWRAGSFSTSAQPILRVIEPQGTGVDVHLEPVAPPAAPGGASPTAGLAGVPSTAAGFIPDRPVRQQLTQINLRFQYGPQEQDNVGVVVAAP